MAVLLRIEGLPALFRPRVARFFPQTVAVALSNMLIEKLAAEQVHILFVDTPAGSHGYVVAVLEMPQLPLEENREGAYPFAEQLRHSFQEILGEQAPLLSVVCPAWLHYGEEKTKNSADLVELPEMREFVRAVTLDRSPAKRRRR